MESSQQAMEYISTLINKINAFSVSNEDEGQVKKQIVNQLTNIHSYLSAISELLKKYGKE